MNIYQKLQTARVELQRMKLKMSGKNDYSRYSYYELSDLLPAINELCLKHDLFTRFIVIQDHREKAILTLYNASDPTEKIDFVIPTAEVEIGKKKDGTGGAEPIQNLGGKTTYLRRYLMMIAFEVIESDLVEQIQIHMTSEIGEKDLLLIKSAPDFESLTKICASLKSKYSVKLITPEFNRRKVELEQSEAK